MPLGINSPRGDKKRGEGGGAKKAKVEENTAQDGYRAQKLFAEEYRSITGEGDSEIARENLDTGR